LQGRAQVFVGPEKAFESRQYPIPEVEGKGLLVRVGMASVCGTDLHIWHGKRQTPLPIILGHEAMGTIEKKGTEVKADSSGEEVRDGDRITWSYIKTCGDCYYCSILKEPAGCLNRFVYGLWASCDAPPHFNGAFSQYIYLRPGTSFFKVPEDLSDRMVAPANCALATMVNVMEKARSKLNENVIIQGCGPLGLYATALAKERGALKVITLDVAESRLEFAKLFGADIALNVAGLKDEELISRIKDSTNGLGADIVLEASGVPSVVPVGLRLLRDGGRYVTVGPIFQGASTEIDLYNLIFRRIELVGTARNEASHLLDGLKFLSRTRQKYPYEKIVGIEFDLGDLEHAFKAVDHREVMRAAVRAED
jgi:D-arabinose 1-dehydrogenase-like Zn-dependent alcohol dehydrogenase